MKSWLHLHIMACGCRLSWSVGVEWESGMSVSMLRHRKHFHGCGYSVTGLVAGGSCLFIFVQAVLWCVSSACSGGIT